MNVRELMHSGVITCPGEATIGEVAALLVRHRVHAIFVRGSGGTISGVLSDIDLLSGEWLSTDDESFETMGRMTAAELMSAPVRTIGSEADLLEAAAAMRDGHVARLLVLESQQPVGVLAVSDLVRALGTAPKNRSVVADVMSRAFVVARSDTPLADLARGMSERRSRSIVVVERDGSLAGVATGHDLLAFVESVAGSTAAEVMHTPLTIGPSASLSEAVDEMLRHEVHRLIVVDPDEPGGIPLGLISTTDIVVEMAAPGSPWLEAHG